MEVQIEFVKIQLFFTIFHFMIQSSNGSELHKQQNQESLRVFKNRQSESCQNDINNQNNQSIGADKRVEQEQKHNISEANRLISSNQLKRFKYLRIGLLGISLASFSIQIGLYLIQYTSSKVSLGLFLFLLFTIILLAIFTIVSACKISLKFLSCLKKATIQFLKEPPAYIIQNDQCIITVPNLTTKQNNKARNKTKKLKFQSMKVNNKFIKQTVKNINVQDHNHANKASKKFGRIKKYLYIFLIGKALQISYEITTITLCLIILENPHKQGFNNRVILLLFGYVFELLSFVLLIILLCQIRSIKKSLSESHKLNEQHIITTPNELISVKGALTMISIDEHSHFEPKNRTVSIDINRKNLKQGKFNRDIMKCQFINKSQDFCDSVVNQSKKSVLKNSLFKRQFSRTEKQEKSEREKQDYPQRKRVEINSKKIQYFQYANISPSNSVIEREQNGNGINKIRKSSLNDHRKRHKKEKMLQQSNILQKYRERNKRDFVCKSQNFLSHERENDKEKNKSVTLESQTIFT